MNGKRYEFKVLKTILNLPFDIETGVVYHLVDDYVGVLGCPCGCKDVIYLNLIPKESPDDKFTSWKVKGNSISPSINKLYGCKSHFTITNGEVTKN